MALMHYFHMNKRTSGNKVASCWKEKSCEYPSIDSSIIPFGFTEIVCDRDDGDKSRLACGSYSIHGHDNSLRYVFVARHDSLIVTSLSLQKLKSCLNSRFVCLENWDTCMRKLNAPSVEGGMNASEEFFLRRMNENPIQKEYLNPFAENAILGY